MFHTRRGETRVESARVRAACARRTRLHEGACVHLCVCVCECARVHVRGRYTRARATRPRAFTRVCAQVCKCRQVCACAAAPPPLPCLGPPRRQGALYSPPRERKCRAALLGSPAPCRRLFSPSAPPSLSRSRPAAPVPVLPRRRRSRHHEQEEEAVPGHACPPGLRAGAGPRVRRRPA